MNRNFLLSFLILSILIPHQNSLAEWTEVVTNKAGNTYVDLDNIKKVDNFVFFWAVTDFLKPLENQYFSSKVFHQIDCKLFRYKDLNMYFHKEPMGKGIANSPDRNNVEPSKIERLKPIENRLIMFNPSYPHRVSPISGGKRRAIIVNAWPKKPYTFQESENYSRENK